MPEITVSPEQAKKDLIDPRTISKKHDIEGRDLTTANIKAVRAESGSIRKELEVKQAEIKEDENKKDALYRERVEKDAELGKRLNEALVRLKIFIGRGDEKAQSLQKELEAVKTESDSLYGRVFELEREVEELNQKQAELPDPKKLLGEYYQNAETIPLTNQEKREMLKPEVLANLSTEEYIALWRRLNPYFVSHVTRQGFRDHNAMVYHSAGMENFHNGFLRVLEDDKQLRPPLALHGLKTRDEASIKRYLKDWVLEGKDATEARDRLDRLLNFHLASAPKYPDTTAVHFAAQVVADGYYGGESGNEVFFIFPSDVIASQYDYAYNGWEKGFTKAQSETKWNDIFVWPNSTDNPGIPIDAGIVFLPETAPVDPSTGSKYASEVRIIDGKETRVMVEDTLLVSSFLEWGKTLNDKESPPKKAFDTYANERNYYEQQVLQRICYEVMGTELQKLGFNPDASSALAEKIISGLHWRQEDLNDESLLHFIKESGANWKRAEKTVPSKEYWEKYFSEHPDLKPKHVIYYDGDPTTAIYELEQQKDIGKADTSSTDGVFLGFDDRHVSNMQEDPRANNGYEDLVRTAEKIISEHYENRT